MNDLDISLVHVYTGTGKGKTTAAIGLGIRAMGAGLNVTMVSFLKNPGTSELIELSRLTPRFKIIIANKKPRNFYWKLSSEEKQETWQEYQLVFDRIEELISGKDCSILILDEIMAVLKYDIYSVEKVLMIMQQCRDMHIELVLTGRDAPKAIIDNADLVTEMKEIKHPIANGIKARKGIEY